jgi:hypothetical protein
MIGQTQEVAAVPMKCYVRNEQGVEKVAFSGTGWGLARDEQGRAYADSTAGKILLPPGPARCGQ